MPTKGDLTLQHQIAAVRDLMDQHIGLTYLLMPYYKKLLAIAGQGDIEPDKRPIVEEL
jgi:hypothetical protein|tara:strand:- start:101 stop:274 length:174 start_codon:yes stop_codon:yes gene_type:complete